MSLFRNKRFLHAEMTKWNASKFAVFLEYKSLFLYYRLLVAFHWVISSNMILLFLKSELTIIVLYMRNTIQQLQVTLSMFRFLYNVEKLQMKKSLLLFRVLHRPWWKRLCSSLELCVEKGWFPDFFSI